MVPPALLFDLDGTLVETDPLHFAAYRDVLAEHDVPLDWETYASELMGQPNSAITARFLPGLSDAGRAAVADDKEARFRASLETLEPRAGLAELLDWAATNGAPIAAVTNAPRANAERMLDGLGLGARFAVLVIGDELERSKPDPLPYLTAMARLDATPERAVAFEDSPSGLASAAAAGAFVFGMRGPLPDGRLRDAGAAEIIDDFTAPALWRRLGPHRPARKSA